MKQLCLQAVLEWCFSFLILVQLETTKISADPFRNQCNRVGKFSNKHKGYALQNHVIQTIQIGHVMDCTTACLEHASCKSYNIQENPKLCELSDSTKSASSGDFVSRSGFSYYDSGDTVQPGPHCESSPCLNGGTCIETCSPRGYYCVCNTNLLKYKTGEHCETSFPDTCKKVKDLGLSSGDGEYYLYLQRPTCSVPARVYCIDMNLDTPAEYVTLPAGRSVNFGFNNRPTYGKDAHGKTAFDKIRLMLPKRQVIRADWRFAELVEGNVNRPYGTAGDCVYRSSYCGAYVPVGHTKADLTGTDFRFPATIPYTVGSWPACARKLVSPSMSSNQKIWSVKCGGYCGGCSIKILILSVDGC